MRTSFRDSHFVIWKNRVEYHLQKFLNIAIPLDDLPDEAYRIWFDETSFTPKQVGEYIGSKFLLMV